MEKVAKNGRKVKPIALLFCCFLPIYEKWKKSLKMDESLTFLLFFAYLWNMEKVAKNGRKVKPSVTFLLFFAYL